MTYRTVVADFSTNGTRGAAAFSTWIGSGGTLVLLLPQVFDPAGSRAIDEITRHRAALTRRDVKVIALVQAGAEAVQLWHRQLAACLRMDVDLPMIADPSGALSAMFAGEPGGGGPDLRGCAFVDGERRIAWCQIEPEGRDLDGATIVAGIDATLAAGTKGVGALA